MSAEIKAFSNVEIKSEVEGKVLAHFATYDELDHHDDITVKGAFEDGQEVVVSAYNHQSWGGALPVGKGRIHDTERGAVADLQFFMDTQAGRDTFKTVKELGKLQQWSYGFDVVEKDYTEVEEKSVRVLKKVRVHEVSPVLMGAGKSTRTLAVKGNIMDVDELVDAVLERMEEKASGGKPKPKPKPGQKPNQRGNNNENNDNGDEEDDQDEQDESGDENSNGNGNGKKPPPRRRGGKKPSGSGKMRMSDQVEDVITDLKALADRAEEIVTLRKSQGKSDVSDALRGQFTELLKQADRIFDLLPQDEDGYLIPEDEDEERKDTAEMAELQQYAFSLSEEL